MLFHSFTSQAERRKFGGSDFIELQYCRLKKCTSIEEIVSVYTIEHWEDDSLYIFGDDWNTFYDLYKEIIKNGTYNNLETGYLDGLGINYFSSEQTEAIIRLLQQEKPTDYQVLLDWLKKGREYNGFYVLGV